MTPSRKLSLAVIAALYAVGTGTTAAAIGDGSNLKAIELTDAIKHYNEQLQEQRKRSSNGSLNNKPNNHRNIALKQKVDFHYENGLNGEYTYIVELTDEPVARYQGNLSGLAATSPRISGQKLLTAQTARKGTNLNAVNQYTQFLQQKQQGILSQAASLGILSSATNIKASYTKAFNGMAVKLTQDQAARLSQLTGIRSVTREKLYKLHTDVGPQHIGADQIWTASATDAEYKGEGIVVGVLDTGINSDHPAFADVAADGYDHQLPSRYNGYLGDCAEEEFAAMCNDKLIGVHSYNVITDSYSDYYWMINGGQMSLPVRPQNGEDYNGHGSHTSSTATGNVLYDVDYKVPGLEESSDGVSTGLVLPRISGVAPRANVIMYQVCFPGDGSVAGTEYYAGCPSSALLAGIEDAIADGVDVINFSIGSTYGSFPWDDPVELAFLSAREAGISVAASAGNAYDPAYASEARGAIDHFSPWLTSVAAATHSRAFEVSDKFLNAATADGTTNTLANLSGSGIGPSYTGPIIAAAAYGEQYTQCNESFPADFFAADPSGTPFEKAPIVVCQRGEIARVAKAENVAAGGAGGFVLYNANYGETMADDTYVIPGIMIDSNEWWGSWENGYYGLQAWLAEGSNHQITITESELQITTRDADHIADFSSRGPNFDAPDVMSPNLAAPGVDIYAAYADEMPFTTSPMPSDYIAISGTSMAAPHVAGAMALLTQAKPEWTPAQIQSALMTTASMEGVTRTLDGSNAWNTGIEDAQFSDAGSGVINVARAVKAGLLLDETAEHYNAANPKNGGQIYTLNLPYLYNDNCDRSCNFIRTFTATTDGTWDIEAEVLTTLGAPYLELSVSPSSLTLAAGETGVISVTAKVTEVQAVGADTSAEQLLGKVTLTPTSSELPTQYLPVGIRLGTNDLPESLSATIHRESGHVLLKDLITPDVSEFNGMVHGLTKAEIKEFTLTSLPNEYRAYGGIYGSTDWTAADLTATGGAHIEFFDVPEGTKRVVLEIAEADLNAFSALDIGYDVNGDNDIQWTDEALCYSVLDGGDYCAINDPTPGRYWMIISNYKDEWLDPENLADHFKVALAMIPEGEGSNATLTGPEGAVASGTPYSVQLNHQLSELNEGDIYYGLVELGSDAYNTGNLGNVGVKLSVGGDDVTISASQYAAKVGDVIAYEVNVLPNLAGGERALTLDIALPEGLQLIEDSVSVASINDLSQGLSISEGQISLAASQPSSLDLARTYVFTSNHEDEQCRVPYGDNPAFYDLAAYYSPMVVEGTADNVTIIPRGVSGLPYVPLFGMEEQHATDYLAISPFGYVQFDTGFHFFNAVYPFDENYSEYPATQVAPLWRGDVVMPGYYWDYNRGRYVNVAYAAVDESYYIFQWDGGQEQFINMLQDNLTPDENSYYSIQSFVSLDISFAAGDYELVYAYNSIETANPQYGSIGVKGYVGELGIAGPYQGYLTKGLAYNNVDEVISEGTVFCGDYRGPEQSKITLSFNAKVVASAIGADNSITVTSQYADSEEVVSSYKVTAPSNIQLATIGDITIDENTHSDAINVMYVDTLNTANSIRVEGEHVSAEISGDASGSTFVLTPDTNWHGETTVTVTVTDKANSADSASVSFLLTVLSDGVEVEGCTDSSANNYNSDATVDNGSCTFATETPAKKSGGGSFGMLMMMLLSLGLVRRFRA